MGHHGVGYFTVKGVVPNGRVLPDEPLLPPDGTLGYVERYQDDDVDDGTGVPLKESVMRLTSLIDALHVKQYSLEKTIQSRPGPEAA